LAVGPSFLFIAEGTYPWSSNEVVKSSLIGGYVVSNNQWSPGGTPSLIVSTEPDTGLTLTPQSSVVLAHLAFDGPRVSRFAPSGDPAVLYDVAINQPTPDAPAQFTGTTLFIQCPLLHSLHVKQDFGDRISVIGSRLVGEDFLATASTPATKALNRVLFLRNYFEGRINFDSVAGGSVYFINNVIAASRISLYTPGSAVFVGNSIAPPTGAKIIAGGVTGQMEFIANATFSPAVGGAAPFAEMGQCGTGHHQWQFLDNAFSNALPAVLEPTDGACGPYEILADLAGETILNGNCPRGSADPCQRSERNLITPLIASHTASAVDIASLRPTTDQTHQAIVAVGQSPFKWNTQIPTAVAGDYDGACRDFEAFTLGAFEPQEP